MDSMYTYCNNYISTTLTGIPCIPIVHNCKSSTLSWKPNSHNYITIARWHGYLVYIIIYLLRWHGFHDYILYIIVYLARWHGYRVYIIIYLARWHGYLVYIIIYLPRWHEIIVYIYIARCLNKEHKINLKSYLNCVSEKFSLCVI